MGDETSAGPLSPQQPPAAPEAVAPSASAEVTAAFDSSTKPEDSSATQPPPSAPPALQAEQPVPVRHKSLSFLQPSTQPGSLGRLGHFEVLQLLGKGGFGIVLKAFDDKLQRLVAIKVLGPQLTGSANARNRFVREARAAAAVNSKYVVSTYEVYEQPIPYLVMEYVVGKSLQDRLDRMEPLATRDILRIGAEIAKGLAAAHQQRLIHRDIKPANILLEPPQQTACDSSPVTPLSEQAGPSQPATVSLPPLGRVKIADFGLARAVDDISLTQAGIIAGTPLFMSPEQARGETLNPRSDLFSLGSVLYTLCTGHPPFEANTSLGVMNRVCEDTPQPIRAINPAIPEALVEIVNRLLVKDRAGRFQTAAEVAEQLEQHLARWDESVPSSQAGILVGGQITDQLSQAAPSLETAQWPGLEALQKRAVARRGAPGRRWKLTLLAVAAVTLAVALGGYLALRPGDSSRAPEDGSPNTKEQAEASKPRTPEKLAVLTSPLEGRQREQIPAELLALAGGGNPAGAPAELVAILAAPGRQFAQDPFHLPANSTGGCIPRTYSPNGKMLVTVGELAPVRVWDTANGVLKASLPAEGGDCNGGPRFSPDGSLLAVFGENRQISLWDTESFRRKHTLQGHKGRIWDACFSPDGSILASVGDDSMVRLWNVATGEPLTSFQASRASISLVRFSPSGKALATYDLGRNYGSTPIPGGAAVKLWDVNPKSKTYLKELRQWAIVQGSQHPPEGCLLFSPDGKSLFYTADSVTNLIQAVEVDTGAPIRSFRFQGERQGIFASALLSNGEKLLVGARMVANFRQSEARLMLTDVRTGKIEGEIALPFRGTFLSSVVSPDGRTVAVGHKDTPHLRLFDLPSLKERVIPIKRVSSVLAVAVRPDGRTIASGDEDGTVRLRDLAGWKPGSIQPPVRELKGHTAAVFSVAFNSDGKLLASSSVDGTLRLSDAEGQTVRTIQGAGARAGSSHVAFSADGKILAAGQENGSVRLWDVASGEEQPPLRWHNGPVSSLAFSPDNRFLASAGFRDRKVHVTDLQTFRKVLTLGPPGDGPAQMQVAFSGDGRTLAYVGWDDTVRLWDLIEKKETELSGAIPGNGGLAVDPTGRFVAASRGGTVWIWDRNAPTQSLVIGPGPFGAIAWQVKFTPEGRFLVVAGFNGTVSILRIPPPPYPATRSSRRSP